VRRWILSGNLPAYETPGGHLRVLKEDVENFLESRRLRGRVSASGVLRILVVDDDSTFRESCVEFFMREPRTKVRQAADGFDAGRQVAEFQPHVVILDLCMPGLDGFTVCRQVKTSPRTRDTRIVVLTGFATEENMKRAQEEGADVCMTKPADMEVLKEIVLDLGRGESDGVRRISRPKSRKEL
jgi:CheY-like chemotaxis protein